MCGRYTLNLDQLKSEFDNLEQLLFDTSYNIAPSYIVPVIVADQYNNPQLVEMKWGFSFKNQEEKTISIINARGETLEEKRTFKGLLNGRRCLIPTTGFYEWKKIDQGKIPYFINMKDNNLFYFGGLFREEKVDGQQVKTCVIITINPNQMMEEIHDRMPFIIPADKRMDWLTHNQDTALKMIKPYPTGLMSKRTVSKEVNKPINDGEELIEEFNYEV